MAAAERKNVNKSQAIRDALAQNQKASTKEIVALLKDKGIVVHPAMVYMQKSKTRRAKNKQKRANASAMSQRMSSQNPVVVVTRVKELAMEVGGIKNLKQLVDLLAE